MSVTSLYYTHAWRNDRDNNRQTSMTSFVWMGEAEDTRPAISVDDLTSSRGMGGVWGLTRSTQRRESDARHWQWASLF